MIDFSTLQSVEIPEGTVVKIESGGRILWERMLSFYYVSLGDSIAAGHTINENWETDYGEGSQYGKNGNTSTTIVPGCYTDLIRKDLINTYGSGKVSAKSFARSGDTVADLMEKLTHTTVRNAISKANLVTICIGANDVLQPAMSKLNEYISTGDLNSLATIVEANLATLNNDSAANSYTALFNRLNEINPNARYVFTTVYNPYKYLWAEEGKNGFFGPLLATIPDMSILGIDVDGLIKDGLLSTSYVQLLFNRVNGLSAWAETYVTKLNTVLRNKVSAYPNQNFSVAETKTLFEAFPDRPVSAQKHYNDLVSVEYTKGYDVQTMDWGRLYEDSGDAGTYWLNMATKYVSLSGLDIEGFAEDLVDQIVNKVIVPDVDPHPEEYGQYVLKRSFTDALGWEQLDRYTINFNANGGSGSMGTQNVVGVDGLPAFTNISASGFSAPDVSRYFSGWNTAAGGGGTAYSNGQLVGITGSMTLYAQWAVRYFTVKYTHSQGDVISFDSGQTGPMECYALYIDGVEQSDLSAFSNPARTYSLPYGTRIKVVAEVDDGDDRSYVSWNGTTVAGKSDSAVYEFTLTSNVTIEMEWNQWYSTSGWLPALQSYWNCYITT